MTASKESTEQLMKESKESNAELMKESKESNAELVSNLQASHNDICSKLGELVSVSKASPRLRGTPPSSGEQGAKEEGFLIPAYKVLSYNIILWCCS